MADPITGRGIAAADHPVFTTEEKGLGILTLACVILTAGVAIFPFIMPSSTMPNIGLTMWDATSSLLTLRIMTVAAIIFVPIVLAYTNLVLLQNVRSPDQRAG